MEAFVFTILPSLPTTGDTIHIYASGTTTDLTGLTDLDGVAFDSPYTIPVDYSTWGFIPPDNTLYDVYWEEAAKYLSVKQISVVI